jgi:hypothetical protein
MGWALSWLGLGACVSCTMVLGIDKNYRADETGAAGTAPHGVGGVGGSGLTGSGGESGSGGGGASGSGGADATCPAGEKYCQGACFAPAPIIGCSIDNCTPCNSPPANAVAVCTGDECSYECIAGYEPSAGSCVQSGIGDDAGSDGSAGSSAGGAGGCDVAACPANTSCRACSACTIAPGCCLANGTCGGLVFGVCLLCPLP